ncbi:helix-turn-helix domain-containing protein [Hymenobacter coccineus]|nr:helix-turn-helix transcriptional regulator [Hymenobacter coccineus]
MYFAKNLRFLRRRAELSQSELGDKLVTDYNTVSRYENGKSTPKLDALTKLAQVFGVSVEALRNQDLTQLLAAPAQPETNAPPTPRHLGEAAIRAVKHPLFVSVELDGTAASLARAVARLTAINNVLVETDEYSQ